MMREPRAPSKFLSGAPAVPGPAGLEAIAGYASGRSAPSTVSGTASDLVEIIAEASSAPDRPDSGRSSEPARESTHLHGAVVPPSEVLAEAAKPQANLDPGTSALVGLCVDDAHPNLAGRVLVRTAAGAGEQDRWLATLAHLPVRREDRVLLLQPANWPEPLVVGVIDGLRARTAVSHAAAALTMKTDETLEIRDADGAPLLAIQPTPDGPVLRLARADQRLEIAGRLTFAADAIDFIARGEVSLTAGGDVVVTGEEIKLN